MPSMIWRIMQILKGKWYLLRPKAEADNSIQEVYNSSYYTKVEFTIVFFVHSKYCFNVYVKFPSSNLLLDAHKGMFILADIIYIAIIICQMI